MKVDNIPGHSGPVNPWGGLHCGYKGPFRNDWQIIDKIIAAQKGAPFDEAWFKDYAAKYNPPPAYGTWDWVESVKYFAGQRQRPIFNLFHTTIIWPGDVECTQCSGYDEPG